MRRYNVVVVTNAFAPYRVPVWNALATLCGRLDIVTITQIESNRLWHEGGGSQIYRLHRLRTHGVYLSALDSGVYFGGRVSNVLNCLKPTHLILTGYTSLQYLVALRWALRHKIPVIFWYESHQLSSRFRGRLASGTRATILRRASKWVVPGTLSRDYLRSMGIPDDKIFTAPNTVDVSLYASVARSTRERPSSIRFLYIGQYLARKGVRELMDAFCALPKGQAVLRCVGYGKLERELREKVAGREAVEYCAPTTTPEETAPHYAWADVVVVPSIREVWGLVINEALAAGCYVIASAMAGAAPDLIGGAPDDVGVLLRAPITAAAIETALRRCIEDGDTIRRSRERIMRWGSRWSPEVTAEGLLNALRAA